MTPMSRRGARITVPLVVMMGARIGSIEAGLKRRRRRKPIGAGKLHNNPTAVVVVVAGAMGNRHQSVRVRAHEQNAW
jgi:hypothetical protein